MKNSASGITAGILLSMAAGAAVGIMGKKLVDDNKKQLKRKADRVADTMEEIADTAKFVFK